MFFSPQITPERSRIQLLVKLSVSLGFLGIVFYLVDWRDAPTLFAKIGFVQFVAALGCLLSGFLFNGLRLMHLQRWLDMRVPCSLFWGTYYSGLAFNNLLPAGIGGDAARLLLLRQRGVAFAPLIVAAVVDRLFGLLGLLMIGSLACLLQAKTLPHIDIDLRAIGCSILFCSLALLWWFPKLLAQRMNSLAGKINAGGEHIVTRSLALHGQLFASPKRLFGLLALSLMSHFSIVLSYAVLGQSLLPKMELANYLLAVPGVMLLLVLPISLGGLGLREISTVGLLAWMGADQQAALTLSLVFLSATWIAVIPGFISAVHYGLNAQAFKARKHDL